MYLAGCHHPDEIPASRIRTVHSNSSAHTMWHWHFFSKPKIALAKVNWASHVEPGKASACYTNCNISQQKKKEKKTSCGTANETFTFTRRRLRMGVQKIKPTQLLSKYCKRKYPTRQASSQDAAHHHNSSSLQIPRRPGVSCPTEGYVLALCIQPIHPSCRKNTETLSEARF